MSTETAPSAPPPEEAKEEASPPLTPEETKAQADKLVAEGKKAIALKQWEEGVAKYADALDLMRQLVGEFDPAMAPLLLSYGKALYELAFSQQGVMGKDEVNKQTDETVRQAVMGDTGATSKIVFSADPTSDDEQEGDNDTGEENAEDGAGEQTVDTSLAPSNADAGGEEETDEPEDDWNAAWEVLDVARTIYTKVVEDAQGEAREEKLYLAECYLALGDVSCETENFPQAVTDYTSALTLKSALLPESSRALASVHYQLATVLEFTPSRRSDALDHVEKALSSFHARLKELSSSTTDNASLSEEVKKMSEKEREQEKKDVQGLIGDLEAKIEELKSAPEPADLVSESINHLLGQPGSSTSGGEVKNDSAPVNDLTSMVKKRKKPVVVAPVKEAVDEMKAAAASVMQGAEEVVQGTKAVVGQVEDGTMMEKAKEVGSGVAQAIETGVSAVQEVVNGSGEKRKTEADESTSKKAKIE